MNVAAVIWDYDGTLVDTRQKNLAVTREIVWEVLHKSFEEFPALATIENYERANAASVNWRDLYGREFGMDEKQTDYAGTRWTHYQLKNTSNVLFFEGLHATIAELGRHCPQGIVSLNSAANIRRSLVENQLDHFFSGIIGYEEVAFSRQKPDPAALVKCISQLGLLEAEGPIVYIGDHETDAHCAINANHYFGKKKIVSIAALYEQPVAALHWFYQPDHIAESTTHITRIIRDI
ncbi:MAG TPA: HAD-IA family hydrolase [Chitinophagaceae bacterium]|nr:HAD-IA family hydrolase [Chitinophagaceae bacterium]